MPTKREIAFWLTRDEAEGAFPHLIVLWKGEAKPQYSLLYGRKQWNRGEDEWRDNHRPLEDAARCFGATVLPCPGQAVPYCLTPGKPITAKGEK